MAEGREPDNIDKEFLRKWFAANCDPYNNNNLPAAPKELVTELARRYVSCCCCLLLCCCCLLLLLLLLFRS